ncbi:MAG TPA: riboflavin synthase [Vicinamibacterales bacterium]|nr:riboflavin synthase [Vicinamibacterales bacterium]
MFTGIVEAVGTLAEVKGTGGGYRVSIRTPLSAELKAGDSLSVNGVCLTVILIDGDHILADVGPETSRVTTLGMLQRGQDVNLERPLKADGRFDGHFVLGHVDGVGVIEEIRPEGESRWLTIGFPPPLAAYFIRKGSVAVDGVSLTIAGLGERQFDVMVIPFTWSNTTLKALRKGDKVNIECDMIGKYAARAMELRRAT